MKRDQKQELRNQDKAALEKRLGDISKELTTKKMDLTMGKLKNVHSMKVLRKERALIKTFLSEN